MCVARTKGNCVVVLVVVVICLIVSKKLKTGCVGLFAVLLTELFMRLALVVRWTALV